jgi:hypothetical protein
VRRMRAPSQSTRYQSMSDKTENKILSPTAMHKDTERSTITEGGGLLCCVLYPQSIE